MKEKLSALVDGELGNDDVPGHLAQLRTDRELRGAWSTYHLIGDALRGHLGPEIVDRVAERLRDEPTVLAPRPRAAPAPRIAWYAMSAAAGAAAVAVVVWTASPMWSLAPEVAKAPGKAAVAVARAPVTAAKPSAARAGVENYLLAHQPFSHTSAMQGIAPYARTVADERGAAPK